MWIQRFLLALFILAFAGSALAYRSFPSTAKRGTMMLTVYPTVVIDGDTYKLSPGSRIWNQYNMILTPASVGNAEYVVNYTVFQGEVDRVWILSDQEITQPLNR
jgi:hypothetical protein